jgi:hypothetical protein
MRYPKTDQEREMYRNLKEWEAESRWKKYEGYVWLALIVGVVVLLPLANLIAALIA